MGRVAQALIEELTAHRGEALAAELREVLGVSPRLAALQKVAQHLNARLSQLKQVLDLNQEYLMESAKELRGLREEMRVVAEDLEGILERHEQQLEALGSTVGSLAYAVAELENRE